MQKVEECLEAPKAHTLDGRWVPPAIETSSGRTVEPIDASASRGFTRQGASTQQLVRNENRDPAPTFAFVVE